MILVAPKFTAPSSSILDAPDVRSLNANRRQAIQRISQDAQAIHCPTLLLQSESHSESAALTKFFDGLSSKQKRRVLLADAKEAFQSDLDSAAQSPVKKFIQDVYEQPVSLDHLTNAHEAGYTYDEQQQLLQPLSLANPKRWAFAAQRLFLNTVGRLSKGVQIGWETGFDSGVSLDHVYENEPRGIGPIGRAIDRVYLDSIGWKGIRQRRVHLQRQLSTAITNAAERGSDDIKILDVATGAGRYVLYTIRTHEASNRIHAELRDFHQHNLDKSKAIASEWNVQNASFVRHDAFAPESYAERTTSVDIAIASGLFELFADNNQVLRSLASIRKTMRPGGVLLYTNQPWHPQLELIARVLPSHQGGKSWVMRRRTQAEMDQLVEQAGFTKSQMDIDEWGIFTVSTAAAR